MVNLAPNKVSSDVVPLDRIVPSALNPRKHFDPEKLQELGHPPRSSAGRL